MGWRGVKGVGHGMGGLDWLPHGVLPGAPTSSPSMNGPGGAGGRRHSPVPSGLYQPLGLPARNLTGHTSPHTAPARPNVWGPATRFTPRAPVDTPVHFVTRAGFKASQTPSHGHGICSCSCCSRSTEHAGRAPVYPEGRCPSVPLPPQRSVARGQGRVQEGAPSPGCAGRGRPSSPRLCKNDPAPPSRGQTQSFPPPRSRPTAPCSPARSPAHAQHQPPSRGSCFCNGAEPLSIS